MDQQEEIYGLIIQNEGCIGLALLPPCQKTVTRVEFDAYSGEIKVAFEGDTRPREMGFLHVSADAGMIAGDQVLVGHFDSMEDFDDYETSREYEVPLLLV